RGDRLIFTMGKPQKAWDRASCERFKYSSGKGAWLDGPMMLRHHWAVSKRARIMTEHSPHLDYLLPDDMPAPLASYSHGVFVPAGSDMVFCSGQLGIGRD